MGIALNCKSKAVVLSAVGDRVSTPQLTNVGARLPAPPEKEVRLNSKVIENLYAMILDEIAQPQYDDGDIALFKDPIYYYGRYLEPRTREYAIRNLVSSVSTAISYLKIGEAAPVSVVDLGCGLGMQSIIFASLGAEVLGVDLSDQCIGLCRKRKSYFEARLRRPLNMEFLQADFRALNPNSIGRKFDTLFSMSAFAYIQPLKDTVAKISELLNSDGRVFLWDENPDYLFFPNTAERRRKALPSSHRVAAEFAQHGFTTDLLCGACAIPHHFWRSGVTFGVTAALNDILRKSLRLSFTYLFGASRQTELLLPATATR
jgi:2-polyprenyl-3-methyl-5-hydroxy-6-metoxy-1,4-benzoquinol methylase